MNPSTPPNPRADGPYADGTAPTDADAHLLAQLDAALAPAAVPAGLTDAVLAATRGRLPDAEPDAEPDADAPLLAQLDAALAPPAAPAGLVDTTLAATRGHLPAAAPVGRIGVGRGVWMKFAAAAALVAIAAGSWWLGPAADPPLAQPSASDPQTSPAFDPALPTAAADDTEAPLDPEAARLLQRFDGSLAAAATPDDPAAEPVGLLAERLAAAADDGPWSGSGFDGIDRAIEWEVSFATADDDAWLF